MLVAVFLQTTPHVSLRLVTTKCSRSHDLLLLKAGATRAGLIMPGFISCSVDALVSEASRNAWDVRQLVDADYGAILCSSDTISV